METTQNVFIENLLAKSEAKKKYKEQLLAESVMIEKGHEAWRKHHPIKTFFCNLFNIPIKYPDFQYNNRCDENSSMPVSAIQDIKECLKTPEQEHNEFLNELKSTSPSFDLLWDMSNFIKYAEKIFIFENNQSSPIYSSKKYQKDTENGFVVKGGTNSQSYIIIVKLFADTNTVIMEVRNVAASSTFDYYFKNNEWYMDYSDIDVLAVEFAQKIIMKQFSDFFDRCYKLKD